MTDKFPPLSFRQGMQLWKEQQLIEMEKSEHISSAEITLLARAGGLEEADEALVEHLALCPRCLGKLVAACRENPAAIAMDVADDWYAGGMLEAAATKSTGGPLSLPSRCGRFMLRIFVEKDDPARGMVALEVIDPALQAEAEGCRATAKDSQGEVLLEGEFAGGRLARLHDSLDAVDLQIWSVVVRRGDRNGNEE